MATLYDLLGVSPYASREEIWHAYGARRAHNPAYVSHYDHAWWVLGDLGRRQEYDRSIGVQWPAPGGAPWSAATVSCRFCGSTPAAPVEFRAHRGMILLMQFISMNGPFCRDCGLAMFRKHTADTLWQGWWGFLSFFITPVIIMINLMQRPRVARLAPPSRHPETVAPLAAPLDPGKPVYQRPEILVPILGLLGLVLLLVAAVVSDPAAAATVGQGSSVSSPA